MSAVKKVSAAEKYRARLKSSYRETFGSECGKHVLMDLYTHLNGNKSSFDPNQNVVLFNEGKRWAWLRIMAQLREEDMEMRKLLEEHTNERLREELNQ